MLELDILLQPSLGVRFPVHCLIFTFQQRVETVEESIGRLNVLLKYA